MTTLDQIRTIKEQVVDGSLPPLKSYVELKQIEKELSEAIKTVQPLAIDEAWGYNQKSFKAFGASIEVKNAPSRYDYSECHHVTEAQKRLKFVQDQCQKAAQHEIYDENGVRYEPAKKIEGATTIAISLIKP